MTIKRDNSINQKDLQKIVPSSWSVLREFLVDFMGGLVPGLFFLSFSLVSIYSAMNCFIVVLFPSIKLKEYLSSFEKMDLELIIIVFILSFIIGSVFYRKDLKEPDKKSAWYIWKKSGENERAKLAVQYDDDGFNVDFPYKYLKQYLLGRDLNHLAAMITWDGLDKKTLHKRSKMFINLIKVRLQYYFPEKCSEIVKNEAHVRLMSSLWYAVKWLISISLICMVIICLIGFYSIGNKLIDKTGYITIAITLNIIVLLLAYIIRSSIIRYIHYQRVREVIFVLETAFIAAKKEKNILMEMD